MMYFTIKAQFILLGFIIVRHFTSCRADRIDDGVSAYENSERIRNITLALQNVIDNKTNYDIRLRPRFGGPAINVGIDIEIASINSISEVDMDYTISMSFRQHWKDERLAYDLSYGNVSLDGRLADHIWVPDTYFVNDKHSFVHDVTVKNRLIKFHHDGSIMYGMRITTVAACMMDLHNYPMDEQNCTLEIESYRQNNELLIGRKIYIQQWRVLTPSDGWKYYIETSDAGTERANSRYALVVAYYTKEDGYTTSDVTYSWFYGNDSIRGIPELEMAQFTLVDYKVVTRIITFSTGAYPRLSLSFRLRRSIGFFILQTYLPSILLVILSWVSFWINHEATSARVALGITTVLTMTTISTSVRASLPRISYIKSIDIYVVVCYAFVFAALVEYALVNFHYWSKQKKKAIEACKNDPSNKKFSTCSTEKLDDYNTQVAIRLAQVDETDNDLASESQWGEEIGLRLMNGPEPPSYNSSITPSPVRYRASSLKYKQRTWANGRARKNTKASKKKMRLMISKATDVDTIDRIARFFFPSCFTIFNLVYWYSYLTRLYSD